MPSTTLKLRVGIIALGCLWLQPFLSGAPERKETIPDDEILTLPKFEVTTERVLAPLEKWRYVSVPGYEILSNASNTHTERFVRDFYLLQQVVQVLMPDLEASSPIPTYIVLCGRGNAFTEFLPADTDEEEIYRSPSFIAQDAERAAIVVDFSTGELSPGEITAHGLAGSAAAGITYQRDPFKLFYTEYFRQLVRRAHQPAAPLWMEEGLVRMFAGLQFTKNRIAFEKVGGSGRRGPANASRQVQQPGGNRTAESLHAGGTRMLDSGGFSRRLSRSSLIPLKVFFATDLTNRRDAGPAYSAQAYLFTQMCLYGRGQKYVKPYYRLVEKAAQGPITEEVFRECFGMTFKQMAIEMRGYVDFTDYKSIEYRAKKGRGMLSAPPFTLREATDAESGRIAGEVLRLAGHKDGALQRLIAPYIRGHTDPEMLAALGLAELDVGRNARAQKFLETAVKHHTTRPRAYHELGKLRLKNATEKAAGENRALTADELAFAAAPLKASIKLPPAMAEAHLLLIQIWNNVAATVTKEDFESLLANTSQLAKNNHKLVYDVAELGIQRGFLDSVRPAVQYGLQNARTPEARQHFEELAAKLPPPTTAVAKPSKNS